jgi:tetratricopeptide (TPR) repeat protein
MSNKGDKIRAKKQQAFACAQANRFEEALKLFQEVCKLDPRDAQSWFMVGTFSARGGNLGEAERALRKSVDLLPNAITYLNLAQTQELQGKLGEAEDAYRRALALKADLPDAHDALGRLSQQRGDMLAAVAYHRQALQLNPARISTYLALAKAYIAIAELDAAAESIGHVLRQDADNVAAHLELARVRMHQGLYDEALKAIGMVLRLEPENVNAKIMEANLLERRHDYQGALDRLTPLLDRYLEYPGVALAYASLAHFTKDYDGAIERLENLLAKADLPAMLRSQIHFNLGQLYDKQRGYGQAFTHYQAGNELLPRTFDNREWQGRISTIINTFTPEALQAAPRAANNSRRPIFIVGMPRSGTTLVEQMLSMYPEVAAAGELPDIDNVAHEFWKLVDKTSPVNDIRQLSQEQCDRLAQPYLDMLAGKYPGAQWVTDKMPQNFLNLGIIALLFPEARVIHCIRDPLDTCLSCYFQMFPSTHAYANNLADLGAYYRQYQRLMEHWRAVLELPIFDACYEDLVADPAKWGRQMVEFCGLTWDERCLEFHKSERAVATASFQQVRQPIYSSSLRRWQHYEDHLEPLKAALAGD